MGGERETVAFISGKFNVLHPGHLRLFRFAREVSDRLLVGIYGDHYSDERILPELERLESVLAISWVDDAFIIKDSLSDAIGRLKPDIVVKGKEHEGKFNVEEGIVRTYGGHIRFASGEASFSSISLLMAELDSESSNIKHASEFLKRRGITREKLRATLKRITSLRTLVVGDLIVDKYVDCQPIGMSSEDPTIVVSPLLTQTFIGGAGIVAAHAASLGGSASLVSVVGQDKAGLDAKELLERFGVDLHIAEDPSRPTTVKTRYRAQNKTLLRVSDLRDHEIDLDTVRGAEDAISKAIDGVDLLVFSDFNYGVLSEQLISSASEMARLRGIPIIADSQSSSQIGDVSKFKEVSLLTPTEREARLAVKDKDSGLVKVVEKLVSETKAEHVIITLDSEGLFLHINEGGEQNWADDRIPALNTKPVDVAGAGDAFLICAGLSIAAGGNIWMSAYIGAIASAHQVGRVGNLPLRHQDLLTELGQ